MRGGRLTSEIGGTNGVCGGWSLKQVGDGRLAHQTGGILGPLPLPFIKVTAVVLMADNNA